MFAFNKHRTEYLKVLKALWLQYFWVKIQKIDSIYMNNTRVVVANEKKFATKSLYNNNFLLALFADKKNYLMSEIRRMSTEF